MELGQWINWGFWLFLNLVATWLIFRPAIKNEKVFKKHSAYYRRTSRAYEEATTIKLMAWIFAFLSLGLTAAVAITALPFVDNGSISIFWVTFLNWAVAILNAYEANANSRSNKITY